MRVFQLRQIPLGQVWALITKIPWDIQSVQNADCRLQSGYNMQTRYKMQNADCRLSTKCRLRRKTVFFFFSHQYDNLRIVTQSLFQGHRPRTFWKPILFLKWAKNIICIQVEIPMSLQVMQLR